MKKGLSFIFILVTIVLLSAFANTQTSNRIVTKEQLGEKLFFDKILSSDQTISCASCHIPQFAFADTLPFSKGVNGKITARNTPSVMNMAARDLYFYDGRAASLEAQVVFPVEHPNEMNLPFHQAVERINHSKEYRKLFFQLYKKNPDSISIVDAIARFEKTLETDQTPNDRWMNDQTDAMTASQLRGRELFTSDKTKCFECHFTPDFTSDEFKNIGLFNGKELNDSGRYTITKNPNDIGKFKIPGLRNVAVTAPYMHDGRFKTLREVIDYYDNPSLFIKNSIGRDSILPEKIGLTEQEKIDLASYLIALTDDQFSAKMKK
jgi:cytochrome c peroxidase